MCPNARVYVYTPKESDTGDCPACQRVVPSNFHTRLLCESAVFLLAHDSLQKKGGAMDELQEGRWQEQPSIQCGSPK